MAQRQHRHPGGQRSGAGAVEPSQRRCSRTPPGRRALPPPAPGTPSPTPGYGANPTAWPLASAGTGPADTDLGEVSTRPGVPVTVLLQTAGAKSRRSARSTGCLCRFSGVPRSGRSAFSVACAAIKQGWITEPGGRRAHDRAYIASVAFLIAGAGFAGLTQVHPRSALWFLLTCAVTYADGIVVVMTRKRADSRSGPAQTGRRRGRSGRDGNRIRGRAGHRAARQRWHRGLRLSPVGFRADGYSSGRAGRRPQHPRRRGDRGQ